jgi:uncharacterized membrane protein YraQ (UPF0718 family)
MPPRKRLKFSDLVDRTTIVFLVLALISATALATLRAPSAAVDAIGAALTLFLKIAPLIVIGLFLGGLVKAMTRPEQIAPWLGAQSGWFGLVLASLLGAVTPGGPFAAFPIVYALFAAGADIGAVVAFLTGWSLLALHRVVIWELPLVGAEFVGLRLLVSLPLPILAGLLARRLVLSVPAFQNIESEVQAAEAARKPEPAK